MAWQQTPFTVPLVVAAVSSLLIAGVAWRHREYTGARSLATLMIGAAWWSATYAVGLANSALAVKLLAYKLMYLGVGVVPVAWLAFAAEYTGRLELLTRRRIGILLAVPSLTVLLIWTNPAHGLIWPTVDTATRNGIVVMDPTHGAGFWLFAGYSYLLLGVGTALVLQMVILADHVYRGQAVALVIAVVIPWGGNALYLSGVSGVWDPTNLGIVISGAILMAAIFRQQLLEVAPVAREVARDEIIDAMEEAVIVVDDHDQVVDLNPAAEALVGRSADDVIGRSLAEVAPALADLADPGDDPAPVRTERALSEADERIYDVRVTPLRRGYGAITGRLLTIRDITDRRERERRIERHQQRLEVINRVLRHDIRNEMNVILGHADDLLTAGRPGDHAERIKARGERIVDLSEKARQLEQVAVTDSVDPGVVDVVAIIEREVVTLEERYPDAEIDVTAPDSADVVAVALIDSAIRNVLENAIEHNDRPVPRVAVTVDADGAREPDGRVRIEIADNGPGMPEREQAVIETGTETALEHSSGLGLWLTYWIVNQSDGTIAFSENTPRGTVITIRLRSPVSNEPGSE